MSSSVTCSYVCCSTTNCKYMVFETTYDHHSGLFTENKYEASRNIVTSYYNFMRLNLGFHTAHHVKPGLHWSDLPQYHESIRSQIPIELISAEEGFVQSSKENIDIVKTSIYFIQQKNKVLV